MNKQDIVERALKIVQRQIALGDQVYRVNENVYKFKNSDGTGFYTITIDPETQALDCNCNYMSYKGICKHIEAIIMMFQQKVFIYEIPEGQLGND